MKDFLFKVLFILIIVLSGNLLTFVFIPYPSNKYYSCLIRENVLIEDVEGKYYFFGDSHVWDFLLHIDNKKLCNCSYPSDSPNDMLNKIRYLIDRELIDRRDTLFIQVDYNNFSRKREQTNNLYLSENMTTSKVYFKHFFPLVNNDKVVSYETLIETYKCLIDFKYPIFIPDLDKANERLRYHFGNYLISEVMKDSYITIFNLLDEYNIPFFLIQYPVYEDYLNNLNQVFKADVDGFLYSQRPYLLDFSTKFQNPEYFNNVDHVSVKGSKELYSLFQATINNGLPE